MRYIFKFNSRHFNTPLHSFLLLYPNLYGNISLGDIMIYVGLTGWGDHYSLYTDITNSNQKLETYAGFFSLVEVDSTYYVVLQQSSNKKCITCAGFYKHVEVYSTNYAVLQQSTIEKWCNETPDNFKFIIKTNQFMTVHGDFRTTYNNIQERFEAYKHMLEPMVKRGKLAYILMQFPPWYDCNEKNINYIRLVKQMLHPLKVAVEFRHESWYKGENKERTLQFLHDQNLIHTIVDEPQVGEG